MLGCIFTYSSLNDGMEGGCMKGSKGWMWPWRRACVDIPQGTVFGHSWACFDLGTLVVLVHFQLLLSAKVQFLHFGSLASA